MTAGPAKGQGRLPAAALLLALAACRTAGAATFDLKADCHAAGDGATDDAPALKACLDRLEAAPPTAPASLHIPAGVYRLGPAAGRLPVLSHGATIAGDGPHATTLLLAPEFDGDVFAWDDAWTDTSARADHIDLQRDATGPTLSGLRITGTQSAAHRQNAVVLYDRDDHLLLRDVEADFLTGDCLAVGRTRRRQEAYIRESTVIDLKCFRTGTPDGAAITLASTAHPGSDATNEVDLYKTAVFDAPGQGVALRNPHAGSATRATRFYGLRIERTGREGLAIGDPADLGQVAGIAVFDLTVIGARAAALRIAAAPGGAQPYGLRVVGGSLGPGNAVGIRIDSGRAIDVALDAIDAPVVLGANAGPDITIGGNGRQTAWRYQGARPAGTVANPLELRTPLTLRGLPGAGDRVGLAAMKAELAGGQTARLTMDDGPADAYNCFNAGFAQAYALDMHVLLQDRDRPARSYAWFMPNAVFSAWHGPGEASLAAGPVSVLQRGAEQASVVAGADTANGCLSLVVRAPPPATERWSASAVLTYVRAP